jgi:hypothetical protein
MEKISERNFLLYAARNYDNPQCMDIDEFKDDLKRINYIKKLFNKYRTTSELKERLIINHLIVIYNTFGSEAATRLLFFKLKEYKDLLKPFLVFLNYMPNYIDGIEDEKILSSDIPLDTKIISKLREI